MGGLLGGWGSNVKPAHAQLFPFPTPDQYQWSNRYILMRAGVTLKEEKGVLETNTLYLTNRENALSPAGVKEAGEATAMMMGNTPTIIKHPLAASTIDTANIVSQKLRLGRDRVVPEFTFMDGRGAGMFNGLELEGTTEAMVAMDKEGRLPPETVDGTGSEGLKNVQVRLRQLMSVLETQYGGETILLIFADEVTAGVWLSSVSGLPLERSWIGAMKPGEVFADVTQEKAREILTNEKRVRAYEERLKRGHVELSKLEDKAREGSISSIEEEEFERSLEEGKKVEEEMKRREGEEERARKEVEEKEREEREAVARARVEEVQRKRREIKEEKRRSDEEITKIKEEKKKAAKEAVAAREARGGGKEISEDAEMGWPITIGAGVFGGAVTMAKMGDDGSYEEERRKEIEDQKRKKEEEESRRITEEQKARDEEEERKLREEKERVRMEVERKKEEEQKRAKEERQVKEFEERFRKEEERRAEEKKATEKIVNGDDDGFEIFADNLMELMEDE